MAADEEKEGRKKKARAGGAPCSGRPWEKHWGVMLGGQRAVALQREGPRL